jgi:hypothetical protein
LCILHALIYVDQITLPLCITQKSKIQWQEEVWQRSFLFSSPDTAQYGKWLHYYILRPELLLFERLAAEIGLKLQLSGHDCGLAWSHTRLWTITNVTILSEVRRPMKHKLCKQKIVLDTSHSYTRPPLRLPERFDVRSNFTALSIAPIVIHRIQDTNVHSAYFNSISSHLNDP